MPWYIINNDLHRDQEVEFVTKEVQKYAQRQTPTTHECQGNPNLGQHKHSA